MGFKPQYHTFDTKDEVGPSGRVRDGRGGLAGSLGGRPCSANDSKSSVRGCSLAHIALSRRSTGRDVADDVRRRDGQKIQSATVLGELATLSHLYTVARSAWGMSYLVNLVPLARAAKPKVPRVWERRLVGDEKARLLTAASPEFRAVIRFALATAMRRGEIASLRWEHVDLGRRCLTISSDNAKNHAARTVPLSPTALNVQKTIPHCIDGSVFGMTVNLISLALKRVIKKAGIEGLHFHGIWHEAISRLFEDTDLDMMEICAISGHKTLQVLARYTHLRTHRLADRLAGMGRTGAIPVN